MIGNKNHYSGVMTLILMMLIYKNVDSKKYTRINKISKEWQIIINKPSININIKTQNNNKIILITNMNSFSRKM